MKGIISWAVLYNMNSMCNKKSRRILDKKQAEK